ncbi:hypothetical protein GQ600_10638 [Phytophthora cactorum]|nr:hypothetical protein GQ600_10638 [Phytophthora cactorum]
MTVVAIIESLPLRPSSAGWAANWVFWIRLTLAGFTLTVAGMMVLRRLVSGLPFTFSNLLIIATGLAAGYTGFSMLTAIGIGSRAKLVVIPSGSVTAVLTFGTAPFASFCGRIWRDFTTF